MVFNTLIWPAIVVQLPSYVQFFATPWTAARQASLFLTISHSLPKFTFIASMMPFNHLILNALFSFCLSSIFPSIRDFSNESAVCIRWPKHGSCSFSISPSYEHPGDMTYGHLNKKTWTKHCSLKSSTCTARFPAVSAFQLCPRILVVATYAWFFGHWDIVGLFCETHLWSPD